MYVFNWAAGWQKGPYHKIWKWCIIWTFYLRGVSKKFVHLQYNFLMTNNIETIFGDLFIWCISSLDGIFQHVESMYYKFTHLSSWPAQVPQSDPENVRFEGYNCSYKSYLIDLENDKIRKKTSEISLKYLEKNRHYCRFLMLYSPLFIKVPIRYWARLCHLTLMWKPVQQYSFVLNNCLTPVYSSLCPNLQNTHSSCYFTKCLRRHHA